MAKGRCCDEEEELGEGNDDGVAWDMFINRV